MYLLRMALLNIGRNRLRSALAVICVLAAVLTNMMMGGLMMGMMGSIVKNYTKNTSGHIRIVNAEFLKREKFMPVDELVDDSAAIIAAIKEEPSLSTKLVSVNDRLSFGVLLSNGEDVRPALTLAGDLEGEKSMLMLQKSILPGGAYPSKPGQALIGEGLAKALGFELGSSVKLVLEKSDAGLRMKKFTVSGIIRSGVNSMDESILFISLSDAKALLGLGQASQQILVMIKDYRQANSAAASLRAALEARGLSEGIAVQPWTEYGGYLGLVSMMEGVYFFIYLVLSFLGAFIITNIMMMVVLERKREIGILKSMGLKPLHILGLFCAEGALLGGIGSVLGTFSGWLFNALIAASGGYDFSSMLKSLAFPSDSHIIPATGPLMALTVLCIGVLVSAIVSFGPARYAARLKPIDAIRAV